MTYGLQAEISYVVHSCWNCSVLERPVWWVLLHRYRTGVRRSIFLQKDISTQFMRSSDRHSRTSSTAVFRTLGLCQLTLSVMCSVLHLIYLLHVSLWVLLYRSFVFTLISKRHIYIESRSINRNPWQIFVESEYLVFYLECGNVGVFPCYRTIS
jgi:hypothetical protein